MNKEEILEAVKQNGVSLSYASDERKNDKEIVLEAIKQNGESLHYVSEELRNDKEILYILKDFLTRNKNYFSKEYDLLVRYEREGELIKNIDEREKSTKIRKKI